MYGKNDFVEVTKNLRYRFENNFVDHQNNCVKKLEHDEQCCNDILTISLNVLL